MSENKEKSNKPMSDEELLAMYANELGQSLKKEDFTCTGCTDKKYCKCARETSQHNKRKTGKRKY